MIRHEETICDSIYPLTITSDRYSGVYSKGAYLAWNLEPCDVPEEPFCGDVEAMYFWDTTDVICGKGDSPEAAIADLYVQLLKGGEV